MKAYNIWDLEVTDMRKLTVVACLDEMIHGTTQYDGFSWLDPPLMENVKKCRNKPYAYCGALLFLYTGKI